MNKKCCVEGCGGVPIYKGRMYCQKHYKRLKKHGTTDTIKRSKGPLSERFWLYVDKQGPNDCWNWTGGTGPNGYGRTSDKGRVDLVAHRVSYELANGQIPPGKIIMHSCDNRLCVNPAHLSVGTHMENMHDMIQKGRDRHPIKYGEDSPRAKLTNAAVKVIREEKYLTNAELARRFGVTPAAIRAVRMGFTWRNTD